RDRFNRNRILAVGDRLADHDVFDAGEADDVARRGLQGVDAFETFERVELRDGRLFDRTVDLADRDRVAYLDVTVEDASDGQPAQVVARVEIGDQRLKRRPRRPAPPREWV